MDVLDSDSTTIGETTHRHPVGTYDGHDEYRGDGMIHVIDVPPRSFEA
jgi:hypothetical protein